MLGSKKSGSSAVTFGRNIKEEELKNIIETFKQKCIKNNIDMPPKVETEFINRLKQASKGDTKPKLNFTGAGFNTQYTMLLVETLAASPLIAKLELGNNQLSDKAAMYLLRLMKGQMKLMKIPADKRLHGVFLGSIDISENSEAIDPKILDELTKVGFGGDHVLCMRYLHHVDGCSCLLPACLSWQRSGVVYMYI